ncbi:MAG: 6-bladed beta-propeller [Sediminicola sp.]
MKLGSYILIMTVLSVFICCKNEIDDRTDIYKIFISHSIDHDSIEGIIELNKIVALKNKFGDNFSLDYIDKVEFFEDVLIIFNNANDVVIIFDENGFETTSISSRTHTNLRFTDISDFSIDKTKRKILILSVQNRSMYTFDLKGNFEKEKKIPFQAQTFAIDNNNKNLAFYLSYFDQDRSNLKVTDLGLNYLKYSAFKFPENLKSMDFSSLTGSVKETSWGFLYSDAISSLIHQVKPNGDSFVKYDIKFDSLFYKESEKYRFGNFLKDISLGNVNYLTSKYEENDNYLVFSYNRRKVKQEENTVNFKNGYYFKQKNKLYTTESLKSTFLNSTMSSPLGKTSNGDFISVINPKSHQFNDFLNQKEYGAYSSLFKLNEKIKHQNGEYNLLVLIYNLK